MEQIVGNSSESLKWDTWDIVIKDIQPFLGKDYAGGSRGGQGRAVSCLWLLSAVKLISLHSPEASFHFISCLNTE